MKLFKSRRYNTMLIYGLIFSLILLTISVILFNLSSVIEILKQLIGALSPIIWAAGLTYIINPIVIAIERALGKILSSSRHKNTKRILSIVFASLVILGLLGIILTVVIPDLVLNLPSIYTGIKDELIPGIESRLNEAFPDLKEYTFSKLSGYVSSLEGSILDADVTDIITSIMEILTDVGIGFILAVYMCYSKETLLAQAKKICVAILPKEVCIKIFSVLTQTNSILKGYITSQLLDSVIVGILTLCFMLITHLPYAGVISLTIAVSNVVPIFGPFIGAIPCAVLIMISEPSMAVWFIIFILVLQAVDGNIIAPKLIGNRIGISSFWTLVSITLFGSLFGISGMIIGVPIFAILSELIKAWAEAKLKEKKLPTDREHYSKHYSEIFKEKTAPPK